MSSIEPKSPEISPRQPRPADDRLAELMRRCVEAERALDALTPDDDGEAEASADRAARQELIGHLVGLWEGYSDSVAVVLSDGTIATYTPELDGLAVVPPERVLRAEGPRRRRRRGERGRYLVRDERGHIGQGDDLGDLINLANRLLARGHGGDYAIDRDGDPWGVLSVDVAGSTWSIDGDGGTKVTPGCIII